MSDALLGRGTGGRGQDAIHQKLVEVQRLLREFGRVIVAFSGGVDSTLLVKLAHNVLGKDHVLAVTADSPSLAREELREACQLATHLDVRHQVVQTHEVEDPAYQQNTRARCYCCKRTLFSELEELARTQGIPTVLYGAIEDDRLEDRPGQLAAREHGIRAPLQEAGLTKWEIRELAHLLGLPNWDRPQNACLASRIPHGQTATQEKLQQIEAAEACVHAQGFRQVRVRHMGRHARIEVDPQEVARFQDPALCAVVASAFAALGFETVGIDRSGYHPGGADHHAADELLLSAITRC